MKKNLINNIIKNLKRFWDFVWHSDSLLSWLVLIALAFLITRLLFFPLLGAIVGTRIPIVAVVSESMEHNSLKFNQWWPLSKKWYKEHGFEKEEFENFRFKNGFNKGDVMIIIGKKPKDIKIGEVIVFNANLSNPVIHRVVDKWTDDKGEYFFMTKGDNYKTNPRPGSIEKNINQKDILGKAVFKIPKIGWIKIIFIDILRSVLFRR